MLEPIKYEPDAPFKLFLKHKGKNESEQLKLNEKAMQVLKKWLKEEVSTEESALRDEYWEKTKEIIDSARPSGHKLYSPE